MIKAVWGLEFDYRTDSCYNEPQHEDCQAPVVLGKSGKYVCLCCGEEAEVDDDMKAWLAERDGQKEEVGNCFMCGGKNTMVTYKYKNKVTLEWEAGHGKCKNCGAFFIV